MTSTSCEAFEIVIERRAQDALSAEETETLQTHLLVCPSCQAYAASVEIIDNSLGKMGESALDVVDRGELDRAVRREARLRKHGLLKGVGIGIVGVLLALWGFGRDGERLGLALMLAGTVAVVIGAKSALVRWELRRMADLSRQGDLFVAHRAALARRIRAIEVARWLALAVVLAFAGVAVLAADKTGTERLVWGLLGAMVAGTWTRTLAVELPRLRRELVCLDADVDRRGQP